MRLAAALFLLAGLPPAAADIDKLGWLSGCWAYDGRDPGSGEYWMPPAGDTMFAISRIVRDGQTIAYEYLRIAEADEQSLTLFASPSGQSKAQFALTKLTATEVVFENPEHDFPQRIIYRLNAEDQLLGRIEGQSDGQSISVDFPMTRVACEDFGL